MTDTLPHQLVSLNHRYQGVVVLGELRVDCTELQVVTGQFDLETQAVGVGRHEYAAWN